MNVTTWNNKPITRDTATDDILALYASLNFMVITASNLRRGSGGTYTWTLRIGNRPPIRQAVSETRRRCLDGSL